MVKSVPLATTRSSDDVWMFLLKLIVELLTFSGRLHRWKKRHGQWVGLVPLVRHGKSKKMNEFARTNSGSLSRIRQDQWSSLVPNSRCCHAVIWALNAWKPWKFKLDRWKAGDAWNDKVSTSAECRRCCAFNDSCIQNWWFPEISAYCCCWNGFNAYPLWSPTLLLLLSSWVACLPM